MGVAYWILLLIGLCGCLLGSFALYWSIYQQSQENTFKHLTPDAVLEARRIMRDDLENHLQELARHIHLDLKREMQSLLYKEIADFRKWMSHQSPE